MSDIALEVREVTKAYPGVQALRGVSLTARAGQVHVLVGENGAGKSTLVRLMSGIEQPDSGSVLVGGELVHLSSPAAAQRLGIATVHQELQLVSALTVAENLSLGREPGRRGLLSRRRRSSIARDAMRMLGLDIDVDQPVRRLNVATRQLLEIARAVYFDTKVLLLDEPTAAISGEEASRLFDVMRRLRDKGTAILFISHHLEEVALIGDCVTVLRDGATVSSDDIKSVTTDDLVTRMVGRPISKQYPSRSRSVGASRVKVTGLVTRDLRGIDLTVRAGQILGIAGLIGSGRDSIGRTIFGIEPVVHGRIDIDGTEVRIAGPADAKGRGIGLLPEDRKTTGLVLQLSIADNIGLASLSRLARFGQFISRRRRRSLAVQYIDLLRIRTRGPDEVVRNLSGGNQQKVMLARWLATQASILFFDEPTRGVDVGARFEFYQLIEEVLANGAAVVFSSSDLHELVGMADEVIAMRAGKITGVLAGPDLNVDRLLSIVA